MMQLLATHADLASLPIPDDSDDDIDQLVSVICESLGSRRPALETFDTTFNHGDFA